MKQKSLLGAAALLLALFLSQWLENRQPEPTGDARSVPVTLSTGQSGTVLTIDAEIVKSLPDDNEGSRHQRFLIRMPSGQRLLVAHNIDLAQRVKNPVAGEPIRIRGQFEWNDKGGVLHWTHHDPRGTHDDGWIEYQGRRYQ
jgi:Protein of unknown function (DUF3465)